VAAPYWSSEDKVKARFWLAGVFALTLATTGISVGFNFLGRDFYNALASKYANFDFIKISRIALSSFRQVNYCFLKIMSRSSSGLVQNRIGFVASYCDGIYVAVGAYTGIFLIFGRIVDCRQGSGAIL
jgi:hypothetical protein